MDRQSVGLLGGQLASVLVTDAKWSCCHNAVLEPKHQRIVHYPPLISARLHSQSAQRGPRDMPEEPKLYLRQAQTTTAAPTTDGSADGCAREEPKHQLPYTSQPSGASPLGRQPLVRRFERMMGSLFSPCSICWGNHANQMSRLLGF